MSGLKMATLVTSAIIYTIIGCATFINNRDTRDAAGSTLLVAATWPVFTIMVGAMAGVYIVVLGGSSARCSSGSP